MSRRIGLPVALTRGLARIGPLRDLHGRLLARLVASSLARSGTGLATVLLTRDVLAAALQPNAPSPLGFPAAVAVLAVCLVGSSLLAYDNRVTQQRLAQAVELSVMERLLAHLLRLGAPFFDRQSPGDLLQAVRQDVSALRTLVFALAGIVLELAHAVGLFIAAFWLSPRLTFWSLVVLPAAVIPVLVAARRASLRSRSIRVSGYAVFDALLELLRGVRSVQVYRGNAVTLRDTLARSRRYFDELLEMVRVQSTAQMLLELIAGSGLLVVIVVGAGDVVAGRMTWPSLLAFLVAIRALYGPVNQVNEHLVSLGALRASTERVDELLQQEPTVIDRPGARAITHGPREIRIEQLTFAYGERTVLHEVSFDARAGETIGIVGPSGAGKSTLLALLGRFYDPLGGAIRLDSEDVRDLSLESFHGLLGLVTQEPFLFAATVRENILVGRPSADDREVEDTARAVGLHEEILSLEQGYDTRIGLGGSGVSGGQAQRIAIARALLRNPPVLLLDEATSSLDSESEQRVQMALEPLLAGRTAFVVAHRLSTLRAASRILVLDGGRTVGFGTHAELLRSCPLYVQLWQLQRLDVDPLRVA